MSVSLFPYNHIFQKPQFKRHQIFPECCLLPWLGPPLTTMQYYYYYYYYNAAFNAPCVGHKDDELLCISGFVDDAMLTQNGQAWRREKGVCSTWLTSGSTDSIRPWIRRILTVTFHGTARGRSMILRSHFSSYKVGVSNDATQFYSAWQISASAYRSLSALKHMKSPTSIVCANVVRV